MKKRIYAFALSVTMLLGSFALPTAAETLTGDVLDEMGYEDIYDVPLEAKAEGDTPGTLPVSLAGDVLDDEMGYEDINAVPWGYWRNGGVGNGTDNPAPYLFMYTTGGVNQPTEFTGETWYDDESKVTKSGTVAVENGSLKLTRTAAKNTGDTISLNKFLSTGAQPALKCRLEFNTIIIGADRLL